VYIVSFSVVCGRYLVVDTSYVLTRLRGYIGSLCRCAGYYFRASAKHRTPGEKLYLFYYLNFWRIPCISWVVIAVRRFVFLSLIVGSLSIVTCP